MKIALSKFTIQNLRVINHLDPNVRELYRELIWRIAMAGIYIRITSGTRTSEEQDKLYAIGRTKPGRPVTWVNDSQSWHNWGLAIDIAPLWRIGPAQFKAWYSRPYFDVIERIARELNIEHPWPSDQPHFHYQGKLTIRELKEGAKIKKPSFVVIEKPPLLERAIVRALSRV